MSLVQGVHHSIPGRGFQGFGGPSAIPSDVGNKTTNQEPSDRTVIGVTTSSHPKVHRLRNPTNRLGHGDLAFVLVDSQMHYTRDAYPDNGPPNLRNTSSITSNVQSPAVVGIVHLNYLLKEFAREDAAAGGVGGGRWYQDPVAVSEWARFFGVVHATAQAKTQQDYRRENEADLHVVVDGRTSTQELFYPIENGQLGPSVWKLHGGADIFVQFGVENVRVVRNAPSIPLVQVTAIAYNNVLSPATATRRNHPVLFDYSNAQKLGATVSEHDADDRFAGRPCNENAVFVRVGTVVFPANLNRCAAVHCLNSCTNIDALRRCEKLDMYIN